LATGRVRLIERVRFTGSSVALSETTLDRRFDLV
jgi:hypothetical protein